MGPHTGGFPRPHHPDLASAAVQLPLGIRGCDASRSATTPKAMLTPSSSDVPFLTPTRTAAALSASAPSPAVVFGGLPQWRVEFSEDPARYLRWLPYDTPVDFPTVRPTASRRGANYTTVLTRAIEVSLADCGTPRCAFRRAAEMLCARRWLYPTAVQALATRRDWTNPWNPASPLGKLAEAKRWVDDGASRAKRPPFRVASLWLPWRRCPTRLLRPALADASLVVVQPVYFSLRSLTLPCARAQGARANATQRGRARDARCQARAATVGVQHERRHARGANRKGVGLNLQQRGADGRADK